MPLLLQHRLDPSCRLVRLMLGEYGIDPRLEDVSHWRREARLTEIDAAATVPLLIEDGEPPLIGPSPVMFHVEQRYAPSQVAGLTPLEPQARAEMWRLFDWVNLRFNDEVTRYVLEEKIGKRELNQGAPDPSALRAAKANLAEHMQYFTYLLATRRWLAGAELSLADFILAAHLSALDYLGDIAWDAHEEVRSWYARVKSRPAFRPLLNDRVLGMPPSKSYADLDF